MQTEIGPTEFVRLSLELNLFFLRIMKEHGIFMEASFAPKDANLAAQADRFKQGFRDLLWETAQMANGHVSDTVLKSGEVVTDDTEKLEEMTQKLLGIAIDTALTRYEKELKAGPGDARMEAEVYDLNSRALNLTKSLIEFKTMILRDKKNCTLFTNQFYSELEHLRDEAQHYSWEIQVLQKKHSLAGKRFILEEKAFWDYKMGDHAEYIAHLLDPGENRWIKRAQALTSSFNKLGRRADNAQDKGILNSKLKILVREEISSTRSLADLKNTISEDYQECKVQALFPPLWPDHVLREAYHFLRELRQYYSTL